MCFFYLFFDISLSGRRAADFVDVLILNITGWMWSEDSHPGEVIRKVTHGNWTLLKWAVQIRCNECL